MDRRFNIIILETNPTEVELLEHQLRKSGVLYSTKRVGSTDLLLETAATFPPDLVIANHALPKFDVAGSIARTKEKFPGARWLVFALNGNEETAAQCFKAGASDFILKRHIGRFAASVREILQQPAPEPPEAPPPPQPEAKQETPQTDFYRQIVDFSPDLIAVLNLDGRREYNNPAYASVLDDPDILVGTDSFLDIIQEDRDRIKGLFSEIVERGYGERTQYRLMDKSGDVRTIESNSALMLDSKGSPEKVVVVSRDITTMVRDRQRFENLVASVAGLTGEEFFRVGVQRLSEALEVRYIFAARTIDDTRKRLKTVAYAADGALQANFEFEVVGNACERVVRAAEVSCHPSGVPALFPAMGTLLGMEAESYFGVPLLGADGHVLGLLAAIDDRPMKNQERIDFIMRVIGKRASLELERLLAPPASAPAPAPAAPAVPAGLKDSEARFRTGVEGLPYPVLMTDDRGTITLVNQKMEGLCGRRADELLGRRAWPLVLQGGPWVLLKEDYSDTIARSDRTEQPVNVYAIPCRNSEGRISGTMGIITPMKSP